MSKEVFMRVKPIFSTLLLLAVAVLFLPHPTPAATAPDFVVLAKDLKPAVVNIST
jgi:hypothetical protein